MPEDLGESVMTVRIPTELHRTMKALAAREGTTLKKLTIEAFEKLLKEREEQGRRGQA